MPGFELISSEEQEAVNKIFKDGGILFAHGFDSVRKNFTVREFEGDLQEYLGSKHALAVSSGTAAIKIALKALGVKPGDEVITQAFNFIATIEAILDIGAIPVITNVNKTLNMDPIDCENRITNKTKVILPVHMLGVPAEMREIMNIATKHNLKVLEDNCESLGAKYEKKFLGTIGDAGAFSFDFGKVITTGEGGMVSSNDHRIDKYSREYHDHGHENNPDFPRWEDSRSSSGFNFRMNEMQGAVGLAQLRKLDYVVKRQRNNAHLIQKEISDLPIEMRSIPEESIETADALVFFVNNDQVAKDCRDALLDFGLGTKILPEAITWHFAGTWDHMPELINRSPKALHNAFPKSITLLNRSVSLPISINMIDNFQFKIKDALSSVLLP